MAHLNLRDDARGRESDDEDGWDTDWEHLSESTNEPTSVNTEGMVVSTPSVPFPGPSSFDKEAYKSKMQELHSTLHTTRSVENPYSEALPSSTPTRITTGESDPTSTASNGFGSQNPPEYRKDGHKPPGMYAVAAMVPVIVMAILGVLAFFYLRKRRRQKKSARAASEAQMREMKEGNQRVVSAHYAATPPSPPPAAQPQYPITPNTPPPPISPIAPQPVILGPIGSSSNAAYFTGIDTSDALSVNDRTALNDRTGLGDPFADGNSIQDEPPPPYRPSSLPPTSIAPSSRNSSLRHPPSSSTTNLIPRSQTTERSPFADPDDDDNVSEMSGPTSRRPRDVMSDVSDLSYQEEPGRARPPV